ncbi:MAG: Calx-beta domain-containing protein [Gammaproteobacteria bacterium]
MCAAGALLAVALLASPVSSAAPKRIYLALDDHTDYLWSGNEQQYQQAFLEMLDYYLDLADQTASDPPAYQSRFNTDGSFWIWTYEHNKTPAELDRLIDRIRSGHISVPLNALVSTYGAQPAEAVLRGMYYAGRLERRFGVRFPLVQAMENQTMPLGLGALWAGAGARYTWKGVCRCVTKVPELSDRDHEIYRWAGLDGSSLLIKWNSLFANNRSIGGYAECRDPVAAVSFLDSDPGFLARWPYQVSGAFGHGWDDLKTLTDEFPSVAQSQTNATRQVIVSNEADFFEDFEAAHGAGLPRVSLSFGNEWDTYSASMAEVTGRVRRAVEKLRSAESLATLVSLRDAAFLAGREAARDLAWMDIGLYWEHDWTADGPVPRAERAAWQRRIAGEIESYVGDLHADAASALGGLIQAPGGNLRFYAFNPLGWARTDMADLPYADPAPVHVVEVESGQEVPSQIVTVDGQRRLRVMARDVPSVGYKVYEVRPGAGAAFPDAAVVAGSVIENDLYRITLAGAGAITSLLDKRRQNRELVRSIAGRSVNDLGIGAGTLAVENQGPVSVTLKAAAGTPLSHETRVTLLADGDRIEIRNDITQNFSSVQTWAFGFDLDTPDVHHEEVGAILRARLASQGGHYSDRNARYSWLTLNHFADMSEGPAGPGVTLSSADLSFMRLGASSNSVLDTSTPQISVLAGGQVDGSRLGIPNQGGDSNFLQRFALRSHGGYDAVSAMRFALEHQNPLVTEVVTGGSAYPADRYSFLSISDPDVLLWSLKPAEEGIDQGMVVRLWNLGPDATFSVSLDPPIAAAERTTHIETPLAAATILADGFRGAAAARQLVTYRLGTQVALSISDVTLGEGDANAKFDVSLSAASGEPVTVAYATLDGSATAPGDYAARSGTLSFAPGVTTHTLSIPVVADTLAEPTETFLLRLSGPTNATLADDEAVATLLDDDTLAFSRDHPRLQCTRSSCRVLIRCIVIQSPGAPCSNRFDLFVRNSALGRRDGAPARAPGSTRFATGRAEIAAGTTADVKLRLTKRGRQFVRTGKKTRIKGVLEIRNDTGTAIVKSKRVTLRLKRR